MYRVTARAFGERAGALAALTLNLSAVFSVSTGSWVLPDGPLMCALMASAYCLTRVLLDPAGERMAWRWWLGAGAWAGVALLSKYQAALFLVGVALFVAVRPRQRAWLRRPEPYVAVALALAMFLPVVAWNARHGWASFAFQLGRGTSPAHVTALRRIEALGQNVAGQVAWVLPWIWVPLVAALAGSIRQRPSDDRRWFFACLAIVPIALFTAMALGGQPGLPHWPASGYLFVFPLLGAAAAGESTGAAASHAGSVIGSASQRRWLVGSTLALVGLAALAASATLTGWVGRAMPALFRRGDPTLEAVDWRDARPTVDSLMATLPAPRFVAATSWTQAGKIAYAMGPGVPVLCLSGDPRHFGFLHDQREYVGQDAVIVDRWPTRHDIAAQYGPYFETVTMVGRVAVRRAGRPAFDIALYIGRRFQRPYPAPALPAGALPSGPVALGAPSLLSGYYLPPDLEHPPPIPPERAP
jgi:hypothetical protein